MSSGARVVLSLLPVMVLAGCGDGGSTAKRVDASGSGDVGGTTAITPVSPATIASFEGTYALESFTVNPTACDVEGPAETSSHDMTFVIVGGPAPEPRYLGLAACSDALECADTVAAIRTGGGFSADYGLILDEELGPSLLRGDSTYPGRYADGMCTGRLWYESQLARAGDAVRVETRTIPLADATSDTKTCTSGSPAQMVREAQGRACSALRVIAGRKTGPLP